MKCSDAKKMIPELIEDSLDTSTKIALEAHIKGCSSCAEELESIKQLKHNLAKMQQIPAPKYFTSNVMSKIHASEHETFFSRVIHSITAAFPVEAAALVIIAAITFFYVNPFDNQKQIPLPETLQTSEHEEVPVEKKKKPKIKEKTVSQPQRITRAEIKKMPADKISKTAKGIQVDEEAAEIISGIEETARKKETTGAAVSDSVPAEKLMQNKSFSAKSRKKIYSAEKDRLNPFDEIIRASASFENAEIITDNRNILKVKISEGQKNDFMIKIKVLTEKHSLKFTAERDKSTPGYVIFTFMK